MEVGEGVRKRGGREGVSEDRERERRERGGREVGTLGENEMK